VALGHDRRGDDVIVLEILSAVEHDARLTQRSVASELGIALGLANSYLKRCVTKGLIKVSEAPARRYAYYLTPKGFAEKSRLTAEYLSHSFSFFRRARAQCEAIFTRVIETGQRRIVLVGEGDLADVARLIANEHAVEIVATLPDLSTAAAARKAFAKTPPFDCAVVVSLAVPTEVFAACKEVLGSGAVYAPPLLRIPRAGGGASDRSRAPNGRTISL
jgi:predicted transcriptional regulator